MKIYLAISKELFLTVFSLGDGTNPSRDNLLLHEDEYSELSEEDSDTDWNRRDSWNSHVRIYFAVLVFRTPLYCKFYIYIKEKYNFNITFAVLIFICNFSISENFCAFFPLHVRKEYIKFYICN